MQTRIDSLDVLRGIAILGTLATNIWIFTHPEGLFGYMVTGPAIERGWVVSGAFLQQLSQGKFLGLLSIMFGIGLALQRQAALAHGASWPGRYPLRAALLFFDGVLHYLLVAEFDVLMGYAVTGLVVAWLLRTRPRSQWIWIGVAGLMHLALISLIVTALALGQDSAAAQAGPLLSPNPYASGSWWDLVLFRIEHMARFRIEPLLIFALTVALFLLGARLLDAGVLEPRGAPLRRRLAWVGLGLAFPLDLAIGMLGGDAGFMASRYGTAPLVSLGLLAVVAGYCLAHPRRGFWERRLVEVGRTALSCYVLQNLVASFLCYGWGLGLAAAVPPGQRVPATIGLYLLVAAVVMLAAHLWLRRFHRGPLEWAWQASYRSLSSQRP